MLKLTYVNIIAVLNTLGHSNVSMTVSVANFRNMRYTLRVNSGSTTKQKILNRHNGYLMFNVVFNELGQQ